MRTAVASPRRAGFASRWPPSTHRDRHTGRPLHRALHPHTDLCPPLHPALHPQPAADRHPAPHPQAAPHPHPHPHPASGPHPAPAPAPDAGTVRGQAEGTTPGPVLVTTHRHDPPFAVYRSRMAAVVNVLSFAEPVTPTVFSHARAELEPRMRAIDGFHGMHVVQTSEREVVLIILGDDVATLDRVATEVGSPWMVEHVVPLLAGPPERRVGETITSW